MSKGVDMAEFDNYHVEEIVCPYCGHVYSDSWELSRNVQSNGEIIRTDCEECGKPFEVMVEWELRYTTLKEGE